MASAVVLKEAVFLTRIFLLESFVDVSRNPPSLISLYIPPQHKLLFNRKGRTSRCRQWQAARLDNGGMKCRALFHPFWAGSFDSYTPESWSMTSLSSSIGVMSACFRSEVPRRS